MCTTTSTSGPVFEQTFGYDARGNVTTLGYPKCTAVCTNLTQVPTVTNTYTNGFLSTVTGNALGVVTPGTSAIDYHANGLVSSVLMNNGVTWQQGIAPYWMARPTSITTSGATNNLALGGYTYRPRLRRTRATARSRRREGTSSTSIRSG